jgi:GH15 family glucan-1,4-alpha-glucosidase
MLGCGCEITFNETELKLKQVSSELPVLFEMRRALATRGARRGRFHGLVGNGETCALISPGGTVDWMCAPRLDSDFVFGRLIDAESGRFSIKPSNIDGLKWRQSYRPGTPVLETTALDADGKPVLRITDFMPRGRRELRRTIEPVRKELEIVLRVVPTFGNRLIPHTWSRHSVPLGRGRSLRFDAEPAAQALRLYVPERAVAAQTECAGKTGPGLELTLRGIGPLNLILIYSDMLEPHLPDPDTRRVLEQEEEYWRAWLARSAYRGPHAAAFERSLITMKLLTYAPTGAPAAAATTSIPQHPGGGSNWDYRLCWIRDGAYTASAWARAGYTREAARFLDFAFQVMGSEEDKPWQPVYRIDGNPDGSERVLEHLSGYFGDGPVRTGNLAFAQTQNDLEGEVLEALWDYFEATGDTDFLARNWDRIRQCTEYVRGHWSEPDNGIWELRGVLGHYTHSKIMCWTALDRAARIAAALGNEVDADAWRRNAQCIRGDVLKNGWNQKAGAFVLAYGIPVVDTSLLAAPLSGMFEPNHPKVRRMIRRIESDLVYDGPVARNMFETAPFPLVTFWLARYYAMAGDRQRARAIADRNAALTTDLQLFHEHALSAGDQPRPRLDAYVRTGYDLIFAHDTPRDLFTFLGKLGDFYKNRAGFKEKTERPRITAAQARLFRGNFPQLYSHEELVKTLIAIQP